MLQWIHENIAAAFGQFVDRVAGIWGLSWKSLCLKSDFFIDILGMVYYNIDIVQKCPVPTDGIFQERIFLPVAGRDGFAIWQNKSF